MSGFVCPHCGEAIEVFPPVSDERSVWANGLPLLGRIPIDPQLAASPAVGSVAFDPIAERVLELLGRRPAA